MARTSVLVPRRWRAWRPLVLTILLAGLASTAQAQQTIINVPSDARTPQGLGFALHESAISTQSDKAGSYQATNFLIYGWRPNTELCATLYQISSDNSREMALGLGFKSTWDVFEEQAPDLHTRFTFGHMTPVSLGDQSQAVGFFTYTHLAFDIPNTPFRLLAGVAGGSENLWGRSTASALMGLEFPITEHLSFTGEWFSGDHNFSGFIPGVTYHRDDMVLVAGYKMANNFDRDKESVVLEAGFFFGGGGREQRLKKLKDEDSEPHYGIFNRAGKR